MASKFPQSLRLLLGSGGFRTEERISNLVREMRSHFGDISELLFLPFALHDYDDYVSTINSRGLNAGYNLVGLHKFEDPKKAIREAQGIFIGGGNTFRLLRTLYDMDLIDLIRERAHNGLPILGVSAGLNVCCPTICTTNDMPITFPPSFAGLGLFPYQVNPHYINPPRDANFFGETRQDRLLQFQEENPDSIVIGLPEGGILSVRNGVCSLIGASIDVFACRNSTAASNRIVTIDPCNDLFDAQVFKES